MTSSSTSQAPRPPNASELPQLAGHLEGKGYDPEDAAGLPGCAYVAVYDRDVTGCPGYCGKVMSVVWDGSPSFFDVFTWRDGKIALSGRDYDSRECYGCGGKGGTLCGDCWRQRSAKSGVVSELLGALKDLCEIEQDQGPDSRNVPDERPEGYEALIARIEGR